MPYTIGLDYGTNSVRCLIVDVTNGDEAGSCVYEYETGDAGIILDPADHNLARQNPSDYLKGIEVTVKAAITEAKDAVKDFEPDQIIGIGIDTTGSTPIPVDKNGTPLNMLDAFKDNPNAHAWLWKDHTGHAEAAEITALAEKEHPEYIAKCGGTYSSEWFFSKILHCLRTDPKVFDAAHAWAEHADWMPAVLVANHGPFTWGADPATAVEQNVVLEQIAAIALGTITINPNQGPINIALLEKHYLRKHGKNAYYGQPRG